MIIISCLVLNNMALLFGDPTFSESEPGDVPDGLDDLPAEVPDPSEASSKAAGKAHRESLLRYFQS